MQDLCVPSAQSVKDFKSEVKLSLKDYILIVCKLLESYIFSLVLEVINIAAVNCKTSFMRE